MRNKLEIDPELGLIRWTPTVLGGVDKILQEFADNAAVLAPRAFTLADGRIVDMAVRKDLVIVSLPLPSLTLATSFSIRETNVLTPEFVPNRTFVRLAPVWPGPEGMSLRVCMGMTPRDGRYFPGNTQVFAHDAEKRTFKLPLPNQFGDGKLCLGDSLNAVSEPLLPALIEKVLRAIAMTGWNADQLPDMGRARSMFRFAASDNAPLAPLYPWAEMCNPVSTEMTSLAMECLS